MQSSEINGVRYHITNEHDHIQSVVGQSKQWNDEVYHTLVDFIRQNDCAHFLNIGSHIGTVCLPIARLVRKVTAVEAYPPTHEQLLRNIELNRLDNVEAFNVAVGSSDGPAYFLGEDVVCPVEHVNRFKTNTGGMHVFTERDIQDNVRSSALCDRRVGGTMAKLDDLPIVEFDIVLIDAEGGEYDVLFGAIDKIRKYMPIIAIRLWDRAKRARENMHTPRERVIEYLRSLDYVASKRVGDHFFFEPKTATMRSHNDELVAPQTLHAPTGSLLSANAAAELRVQDDGNVVLYSTHTGSAMWSSDTRGAGAHLALQADGNLVLYDSDGHVLWATGTTSGSRLVLQDDCNLVLLDSARSMLWSSGSSCGAAPASLHSRAACTKKDCLLCAFRVDHVFLVNLERRADRREQMLRRLAGIGVEEFTLVNAADGMDLSADYRQYLEWYESVRGHLRNVIDLKPGAPTNNFVNSAGAFGLLRTWQRLCGDILANDGMERVMVIEDDCYFHRDLYAQIGKVDPAVREAYDVVRLGTNQTRWDYCKPTAGAYYDTPKVPFHWALGTFVNVLSVAAVRDMHAELSASSSCRYPATLDLLLWRLSFAKKYTDAVLYPNLAIADVTNTDNMAARSQEDMAKACRWDLSLYDMDDFYQQQSLSFFGDSITNNGHGAADVRIAKEEDVCFVFIIPSYNNEKWVRNNVASVCEQTYPHWRAIYVDDCSSDSTLASAERMAKAYGMQDRFTFLQTVTRMYQAHARYVAYNHESCHANEVAVLLDGDDWLAHKNALTVLAHKYVEHDLQVSYGQFIYFHKNNTEYTSGVGSYPPSVSKDKTYRQYEHWRAQHLRTARVGLLQRIPADYLQLEDGEWLRCCTDIAEMMFVLEESDGRHMNIGEPLAVYNRTSSALNSNSYYNQHLFPDERAYRMKVLQKYAPGLCNAEAVVGGGQIKRSAGAGAGAGA